MDRLQVESSIEVREGWKGYYVFWGIMWFLIFSVAFIIPSQRQESIDFFFRDVTFKKALFILGFLFFPAFCFYYYFDKRVKVRVDELGIWTPKAGTLGWSDIWYFSSTIFKSKEGYLYKLKIRLKDTDECQNKEITIRYRRMDKEFNEVRDIVANYARNYGILDLGHENES